MTQAAVPGRIVVSGLNKHFGSVHAVNDLSFTVEPGSVTGFLGPNGAGKTTTLRMLLGLVTPSAGLATIGGMKYSDIREPLKVVGAVLEASSFHPGRTARNHLRVYAATCGLPDSRVDEVLAQVGLTDAARRKARGFSLGMRQRLGLAMALLGDPQVLILDEPANGLDPEGILWLRGFLRALAGGGRTVLVSSHLLSEVQLTADRVVILSQGRLVTEGTIDELAAGVSTTVVVTTPNADQFAVGLREGGAEEVQQIGTTLRVRGMEAPAIGHLAFTSGVELHELRTERADLEQLFFSLTASEYSGQPVPGGPPPQQPPGGPPPATPGDEWASTAPGGNR